MKKFTSTMAKALILAFMFSTVFSVGAVTPVEAGWWSSVKKAAKYVSKKAYNKGKSIYYAPRDIYRYGKDTGKSAYDLIKIAPKVIYRDGKKVGKWVYRGGKWVYKKVAPTRRPSR